MADEQNEVPQEAPAAPVEEAAPAPAEEPIAEEPAPAPAPDNLTPPKSAGCSPATCGLERREWARLAHWYCDTCNHSTFSADEAAARRPSL